MYQLSRLLHDYHRDLYNHLEENEISPSLYAAPWFLTLFASQFPLGFVARVFGKRCLWSNGTMSFIPRNILSPCGIPIILLYVTQNSILLMEINKCAWLYSESNLLLNEIEIKKERRIGPCDGALIFIYTPRSE